MATYRSFEELDGKTLKFKDEVIFEVPTKFKLPYLVGYDRLNSRSASIIPAQIFIELGLDKTHEANLAYGYPSLMSSYHKQWPVTRLPDYPALTRLVLVLFKKCEELKVTLGISKNTEKETIEVTTVKEGPCEVGDFVKIIDTYDPIHHPLGLLKEMIDKYGGSWCRVTKLLDGANTGWMELETFDKKPIEYKWTKEMFSEHKKVLIESPYKGDVLVDVSESKKETVKEIEGETIQEKPFTIPLNYEEVKLSPKKPICKF